MYMAIGVLVGRLTRDAELKFTTGGQAVAHFTVATSSRKKQGDKWENVPSFWDCDLWGKLAESLTQYMTKGKPVAVEGSMRIDKWEHEGQTRQKVLITANTVQLLASGKPEGKSEPGRVAQSAKEWQGKPAAGEPFEDDDPPF